MLLLIYAVTIVFFPAGAVWAWRRGGGQRLSLVTAVTVGALIVVALILASERGGNRLASAEGYARTATRVLLLAGPALILPVVASALAVWFSGRRMAGASVYLIAAATALCAAGMGTIVAIYALWL